MVSVYKDVRKGIGVSTELFISFCTVNLTKTLSKDNKFSMYMETELRVVRKNFHLQIQNLFLTKEKRSSGDEIWDYLQFDSKTGEKGVLMMRFETIYCSIRRQSFHDLDTPCRKQKSKHKPIIGALWIDTVQLSMLPMLLLSASISVYYFVTHQTSFTRRQWLRLTTVMRTPSWMHSPVGIFSMCSFEFVFLEFKEIWNLDPIFEFALRFFVLKLSQTLP